MHVGYSASPLSGTQLICTEGLKGILEADARDAPTNYSKLIQQRLGFSVDLASPIGIHSSKPHIS